MAGANPLSQVVITSFEPFGNSENIISVPFGTSEQEIGFPTVLFGKTSLNENPALQIDNVTWQSVSGFDGTAPGDYVFTAVLPQGYSAASGVQLPQATVTVLPDPNAQALDAIKEIPVVITGVKMEHNGQQINSGVPEQVKNGDTLKMTFNWAVDYSNNKDLLINDKDYSKLNLWTPEVCRRFGYGVPRVWHA